MIHPETTLPETALPPPPPPETTLYKSNNFIPMTSSTTSILFSISGVQIILTPSLF